MPACWWYLLYKGQSQGSHKDSSRDNSLAPAGQAISTRASCTDLRAAYLYATTPHMFQGDTEKAFNAVRDQVCPSAQHPILAYTGAH